MKKPNVAGSFYPDGKEKLRKQLKGFMSKVVGRADDRYPWGLIAPHAGYVYSGQTAAYAYKQLCGAAYEQVVVMAPSHYLSFDGIAVYPGDEFLTPLGKITVDCAAVEKLTNSSGKIIKSLKPFEREHALEVQLPFLQEVLNDFKLVPLILGNVSLANYEILKSTLLKIIDLEKTLIVASTDLAHFNEGESNDALDSNTIEIIQKGSSSGLLQAAREGEASLCGLGPVITIMLIAGELKSLIKILKHSNSGDVSGDYGSVVGYLAAAYYK